MANQPDTLTPEERAKKVVAGFHFERDYPCISHVESIAAAIREAVADATGQLQDERDALARFKSWTHSYLDAKGIPTHPDGPHSREGCRIGDRMDLVFVEQERLQADNAALRKSLEEIIILARILGIEASGLTTAERLRLRNAHKVLDGTAANALRD